MSRDRLVGAFVVYALCALAACAGTSEIRSTEYDPGDPGPGTVYYLPKKLMKLSLYPAKPRSCAGAHCLICVVVKHDDENDDVWDVSMEALPAVPDRERGFSLSLDHSSWHDDEFTVKTTPEGLLSRVRWNSTGRLPDAIVEASRVVGSITNATVVGLEARVALLTKDDADLSKAWAGGIELIFDPTCLKPANEDLKRTGLEIYARALEPCPVDPATKEPRHRRHEPNELDRGAGCDEHDGASFPGIVYRRPVLYEVSVYARDANGDGEEAEQTRTCPCEIEPKGTRVLSDLVAVPNRGEIATLPMASGSLVERIYSIDFEDGLLTQLRTDEPSEAIAALKVIPEAIGTIISTILPISVDYSSEAEARAAVAAAAAVAGPQPSPTSSPKPAAEPRSIVVLPGTTDDTKGEGGKDSCSGGDDPAEVARPAKKKGRVY